LYWQFTPTPHAGQVLESLSSSTCPANLTSGAAPTTPHHKTNLLSKPETKGVKTMANQMGQGNFNMFAPPAYNGIVQGQLPGGFIDVSFTYTYDVVLSALQNLPNQAVAISNDADFAARAITLASSTGSFQFRLSDSQGYYLSNGYLQSAILLVAGAALPFTMFPEVIFPSGGKIGIDLIDTSNATNTIQLLFHGVKRYEVGG
jgi:hypothetical protein